MATQSKSQKEDFYKQHAIYTQYTQTKQRIAHTLVITDNKLSIQQLQQETHSRNMMSGTMNPEEPK